MKAEIINGGCLEVMPRLIERGVTVDACITDPPYGTTACAWDSVIPFAPMWANLKQLVKRSGAIVLFGSQPFTSALVMSNAQMFRYELIGEKSRPSGFLDANRKPLKSHENILIFSQEQSTYNPQMGKGEPCHIGNGTPVKRANNLYGDFQPVSSAITTDKYPRTIVPMPSADPCELVHPTQKPVELMRYLVRTYTNEGDTVLDFTAGSFTTGVACVIEQRNFIGIELNPDYCQIGEARIKRAQGIPCDVPRFTRRQIETPLFDIRG